jgi:hypothetical protein
LRDKRPIERKKESWTKPSKGTIKLNVDAAYDDDQGHGRLGVVARDYTGKFMGGKLQENPIICRKFVYGRGICAKRRTKFGLIPMLQQNYNSIG